MNKKRKVDSLSENSILNKCSKKQDVTKQYQNFKNMLSDVTIQKIPSTNIEIYKDKNTHLVNLLFENRKLVRLIRERNNKFNIFINNKYEL